MFFHFIVAAINLFNDLCYRLFSDVEILCGVDAGVVRSHRMLLASLSPFLRLVLASQDSCLHDESAIFLPDVASGEHAQVVLFLAFFPPIFVF